MPKLSQSPTAGHTVITTRHHDIDGIPAEGLEILPMGQSEAVQLLLKRAKLSSGRQENVQNEANRIVNALGCLPLAIEQAAAYIRQSKSILEFMDTYHESAKELHARRLSANSQYQHTVATTWKLSFARLKVLKPDSITLITLLAFMNPDLILVEFLKAGRSALREAKNIIDNTFHFRECIHALQMFSLVRVWEEGRKISIHRLVQSVIRDSLNEEKKRDIVSQITELGIVAFPEPETSRFNPISRERSRRFLSQALSCLGYQDESCSPKWHILSDSVAGFLYDEGQYDDCLKLAIMTYSMRKAELGVDHADTLFSMGRLAQAYRYHGDYQEAQRLFAGLLSKRREVLGLEHSQTIWAMNHLGWVYRSLGRHELSFALFQEAYGISNRMLMIPRR